MFLITSIMFLASLVPIECRVTQEGGLKVDESEISLRCRAEGKDLQIRSSAEESDNPERTFAIVDRHKDTVFVGKALWKKIASGEVVGEWNIECMKDIATQDLSPNIRFHTSRYPSLTWTARGQTLKVGEKGYFRSETVKAMAFSLAEGKDVMFRFDNPTYVVARDYRKKSDSHVVRFGMYPKDMSFLKGDVISLKVYLSSPSGLNLHDYRLVRITESDKWIRLENFKDVLPGSALDFSSMGRCDAPSGKYGWLKARDGSFYFEGKEDEPQRFCGANLCMSANFVSHELADTLIDRLIAMGYNAVRIHHHDRDLKKNDNWDRLDYLIARGISKGLYFTTDLFVSRRVRYKELGLEGKGYIKGNLYKNLIPCYEPAFENWCRYAKEFLEHVNPYTGRAYKDEPAIALISLVNEGKLTGVGDKNYWPIKTEWERFGGEGKLRYNSEKFKEFEEYLAGKVWDRCSEYVRSIGCKALLTNDNNGLNHDESQGTASLYDYVDNHFYIDHPKFIGQRYKLPSRCRNVNIIKEGGMAMFKKDYVKTASKPYTVTEWNLCGPNRYRSMAGLVCGAMASVNGWDGLWRFAYSHTAADVADNPESFPSTFNLATDPLNLAAERAVISLFMRGDITDEAGLVMNTHTGTMKVVSDRTCGFFTYGGRYAAGPLEAMISGAPASLWVSSLDELPIETSERLLLVHITDVQGDGVTFADDTRTVLYKWGKGTLVEKGEAEISLALGSAESYAVYELKLNGERVRELETTANAGRLEFRVSTDGPSGGRIYYEIVRK